MLKILIIYSLLLLGINCDIKWWDIESCEPKSSNARSLFVKTKFSCERTPCETKSCNAGSLLVQTESGWIRGVAQHTFLKEVPFTSFTGIPFAEKPIGNLRFKVIL